MPKDDHDKRAVYYEVRANQSSTAFSVVKRNKHSAGGLVLTQYSDLATADTIAGVLNMARGKEHLDG